MDKKLARIAAVVILVGIAAYAVGNTCGMLGEKMWDIWAILNCVAFAVVAVGLLLEKRLIAGIGAIAVAAVQLVLTGLNVMVLVAMGAGSLNWTGVLALVFLVLVALMFFVKKLRGSKVWAAIAGALALALIVIAVVGLIGDMPFAIGIESVPYYVCKAVFAILTYAGLALAAFALKPEE